MKKCRTCQKSENEVEFKLHRRECELCRSAKRLAKYAANPQPTLMRNLAWKRANSETHQAALLNSRFLHRYGITVEQYNLMLKEQNQSCKICKRIDSGRKSSSRLSVDHCHKTGKVRGLLCLQCNSGLGKFKDDARLLSCAITYLETTNEQ